jgi:DNA (cytosine-5)-methyltransferase 1
MRTGNRQRKTKVVGIDLFCGAGGMSRGLQRAGIRVVCGVDNDPVVIRTYKKNIHTRVLCRDIREITASDLRPYLPKNARLILSVCAPCQPFSKVRKSGKKRADRHLLLEVGRLLRSLRPDGLIVENVPQIVRSNARGVLSEFERILHSAGYSHVVGVVDSKHFGVPQTRARMVLLALRGRDRTVQLPSARKRAFRTVRDTIAGLPIIKAGGRSSGHPLHVAASLSKKNLERIRVTPTNGGDSRTWPPRLRLKCHRNLKGFYDVYGRMRWDYPAPTLTTRCISLSNGRFGHPTQCRAISLLEAALLQTFPKRYRFSGNRGEIARQIGNAVPVRLAHCLGASLISQL